MMINQSSFLALPQQERAGLFQGLLGPKPTFLIGTRSASGETNLAIFNNFLHIAANPGLVGIQFRPEGEVPRHTLKNIRETRCLTLNSIPNDRIKEAHWTSAKFGEGQSEFDVCGFGEHYIDGFFAPFVEQSDLKIGFKYHSEVPLPTGVILVIVQFEVLVTDIPTDRILCEGLGSYTSTGATIKLSYASPDTLPSLLV